MFETQVPVLSGLRNSDFLSITAKKYLFGILFTSHDDCVNARILSGRHTNSYSTLLMQCPQATCHYGRIV